MTDLIKLEGCICSSLMYKLLYIFLEIFTSDANIYSFGILYRYYVIRSPFVHFTKWTHRAIHQRKLFRLVIYI